MIVDIMKSTSYIIGSILIHTAATATSIATATATR